jgi:hypothetical protein
VSLECLLELQGHHGDGIVRTDPRNGKASLDLARLMGTGVPTDDSNRRYGLARPPANR